MLTKEKSTQHKNRNTELY